MMLEQRLHTNALSVYDGIFAVDVSLFDAVLRTHRWRLGPYFSRKRAQHAAVLVERYLQHALRVRFVDQRDVEEAYEHAEGIPTYDFDSFGPVLIH